MSIISKFVQRGAGVSNKQLVVAGVFSLALACSVGLGLAMRGNSSAAATRDCDHNSIDYVDVNGGCGAANPAELIQDARNNNPSDLQTIYAANGLPTSAYDQFASTAVEGTINRDGTVVVNGQTVMTNAWTMGRTSLGRPASERKPVTIGGKTYYESAPSVSFASGVNSIPVMVMFDNQGVAQALVMNPCGNVVGGTKVTNSVTCNALQAAQDKNNPNLYSFTTQASVTGNAKISRVVYTFSDDNTTVTKSSPSDVVTHTFKKSGTVKVTVYATVPGGHEIASVNCQKAVEYVAPTAVCTALVPAVLDDKNQQFSFTVKTATKYATVVSADFAETVDGGATTTVTGVKTTDKDGNIYKEYTFTDGKKHTIVVMVTFTTQAGNQTAKCQADVTSKQTPVCTVPGHEGKPIDSNCGYCKPNIPIGDSRCNEQVQGVSTVLPNTGPGDILGLFAGTSVFGAIGHRVYAKRRNARRNAANRAL